MPTIKITFSERDTMPDRLAEKAQELDLTVEELVKRFIASGMGRYSPNEATVPGESLEDFLIKNGLRKPKPE
jgi:hypothetical protein